MEMLSAFLVILFCGGVLTEENSLLVPCKSDDIKCLRVSTSTFLSRTHQGIQQYNFKPIDPLLIPSTIVYEDSTGLIYKHSNLNITGLKNQDISDFKMNTTAKSVVLTTNADLNVAGNLIIEWPKKSKSFTGTFTSHGSVLITATYNYDLKTKDKGVRYFEVGPETIMCKVEGTPHIQGNPELQETLLNDADVKAVSQEKRNEIRSNSFCAIVKEAYKDVIHNLRAAAVLLPASSFFPDI